MLAKTITFLDLDGNQVTDTFYFNLTKPELAELGLSRKGGLDAYLKQIVADEDGSAIIRTFKEIIAMSVGRRSEDGRRFEKSEEITNDFLQTDAYSELFMELVQNADAASEFIRGIVPQDMARSIQNNELPASREYSDEELLQMSDAEFAAVAGRDAQSMSKRHLQIAYQRSSRKAA